MGAPLDRLYGLTPRDSQSALWIPAHGTANATGGLIVNTTFADFTIPPGYIGFLTHIWGRATPGAAQAVQQVSIVVGDINLNSLAVLHTLDVALAVNVPHTVNFSTDIAVIGGDQALSIFGTFGGGAANNVNLGWSGYYVPRGNVTT